MVPSGQPTPIGGHQSVPPSLMRSNSGILGPQGGTLPSQTSFPLVSPHTQFNNMNMLGNVPNVSSLLNQPFVNGGSSHGLSGHGGNQRVIDVGTEPEHLSNLGNGMNFTASSSSFVPANMVPPAGPSQLQGQQFSNSSGNQLMSLDHKQPQQIDAQTFQQNQQPMQQFSAPRGNPQLQSQQQQFNSVRGGLDGLAPIKAEPLVTTSDQPGASQQQLQQLRNLGPVKFEQQQLQSMRSLPLRAATTSPSVKLEPSISEQSLYLQQQQQQQQQQQFLNMIKQTNQSASAAQMDMLQQQRMIVQQQHQQQQQQFLKGIPTQRPSLPQQNLPMRASVRSTYEAGLCARRLSHYMYQQQRRPEDNNIEFWRRFVNEYFAPNARKKWCVSLYGTTRHTPGVFPQILQELWHCEICHRKPGRGFEATYEVLPRLFKIKYESGVLEELLYVDMPREYQNASGQYVLEYEKAIQETVFDTLRVARDGQLRIIFSPDLKIVSWEFCSVRHEELLPRRLLIPQVTQLGVAAQKYTAASQNASNLSVEELQNNCQMFLQSARQVAKSMEVPLVNDLGYTKRYVRCLQISEVVNSMKDLIDYSRLTRSGPMESLAKFPRRTGGFRGESSQQGEQQQQTEGQSSTGDHGSGQSSAIPIASSNGVPSVNNSLNAAGASASASAITGMPHQNSINSRQQSSMNNGSSPYGGNSIAPSPASSSTIPPSQPNASSFQSPTPSLSNNLPQTSQGVGNHISSTTSPVNIPMPQPSLSGEVDHSQSQASVQRMINEMMSNQFNGGGGLVGLPSVGNDMKNVNGVLTGHNAVLNGGNGLMANGSINGPGIGGPGFNSMGGGLGQSAMVNGMRAAMGMGNNSMMNGRVGMPRMIPDQIVNHQQQDLENQYLSGLGAGNGFNNLQFDWKTTP